MKKVLYLFAITILISCQKNRENPHDVTNSNFTVMRLMIINEDNEMLMVKEDSKWFTPSLVFYQRQYLLEGLDSLANSYGVHISTPELRGYIGYKYEYHEYATMRAYFIAKYEGGKPIMPEGKEDLRWMPFDEAIRLTPVKSMQETISQLLKHPNKVWGASYMVYPEGEGFQARRTEDFYPLFSKSN